MKKQREIIICVVCLVILIYTGTITAYGWFTSQSSAKMTFIVKQSCHFNLFNMKTTHVRSYSPRIQVKSSGLVETNETNEEFEEVPVRTYYPSNTWIMNSDLDISTPLFIRVRAEMQSMFSFSPDGINWFKTNQDGVLIPVSTNSSGYFIAVGKFIYLRNSLNSGSLKFYIKSDEIDPNQVQSIYDVKLVLETIDSENYGIENAWNATLAANGSISEIVTPVDKDTSDLISVTSSQYIFTKAQIIGEMRPVTITEFVRVSTPSAISGHDITETTPSAINIQDISETTPGAISLKDISPTTPVAISLEPATIVTPAVTNVQNASETTTEAINQKNMPSTTQIVINVETVPVTIPSAISLQNVSETTTDATNIENKSTTPSAINNK